VTNPALDDASEAIMTRALTDATSETIGVAAAVIYDESSQDAAVEQLAAKLNMERGEAAAKVESVKAAYATEAYQVTAKELETSPAVVKAAQKSGRITFPFWPTRLQRHREGLRCQPRPYRPAAHPQRRAGCRPFSALGPKLKAGTREATRW
jgi:hypothetical protein